MSFAAEGVIVPVGGQPSKISAMTDNGPLITWKAPQPQQAAMIVSNAAYAVFFIALHPENETHGTLKDTRNLAA